MKKFLVGIIFSFGLQYFIYRKFREAGASLLTIIIFIVLALFWFAIGFAASLDIAYPSRNIFPGRVAEILKPLATTWSIIMILAFFAFLGIDILTGFKGFTHRKLYFALILTVTGTIYCFCEAYFVTPRYVAIKSSKIKADKLRLVYVSDVHIGGLSSYWHLERIMRIVEEAEPDIFAMTGDVIDGMMEHRPRELALLTKTAAKAKFGSYAVNGNHEYYWLLDEDVEQIIRDCGYNLLINERAEAAAGITIISLDDNPNGWLKPYLKPEDSERFVLVLKHRPGLPFDAEGKFDLQLSGHTHGGQFWPLGYFKNKVANSTQGLSRKAGGYVYVSNGAGFNGTPMRLFVPPEVTVIDIIKEQ